MEGKVVKVVLLKTSPEIKIRGTIKKTLLIPNLCRISFTDVRTAFGTIHVQFWESTTRERPGIPQFKLFMQDAHMVYIDDSSVKELMNQTNEEFKKFPIVWRGHPIFDYPDEDMTERLINVTRKVFTTLHQVKEEKCIVC